MTKKMKKKDNGHSIVFVVLQELVLQTKNYP